MLRYPEPSFHQLLRIAMGSPFFGHAVFQQDEYLKIVPEPEKIKMPQIKGQKEKKMTERDLHLNPFKQEADLDLYNIHPLPKKEKKRKTCIRQRQEPIKTDCFPRLQGLDE